MSEGPPSRVFMSCALRESSACSASGYGMRQKGFLCCRWLCGIALTLSLTSHASVLRSGRFARAVSSRTQAVPSATDQDDAPAAPSDDGACDAGDDPSGPFDDSVPAEIPAVSSRVIDLTGHLSADCMASTSAHIRSLESEKGSQVRVLLVGSTGGESIEEYANRVFHTWKLGRKGIDDGVLLVAALHDHHARIEVGYGLEGAIPDAVAGDILRADVESKFASGSYGEGVSAAVNDLAHLIRGEPLPKPAPKGNWMWCQLAVAAMLLACLAGAVATLAKLRWYWLLTLPVLAIVCIDVVGVVWHLESRWTVAFALLPFASVTYLAGIFFTNFPKSLLLWLACSTGAFAVYIAITFKFARPALHAFDTFSFLGL